jgi:hypothetical protein
MNNTVSSLPIAISTRRCHAASKSTPQMCGKISTITGGAQPIQLRRSERM